jgi:hypothetical protein
VFRQQEMLAALDAKTRIAVSAREDENKHLKSQVAHYKAASQAELVTQQRDILALLEALTNTTICEEGVRTKAFQSQNMFFYVFFFFFC